MKTILCWSGILLFICGAFLAPLLTSLIPLSLENWKFWLYFRVIWVVVGGLWCGFGFATLIGYKPVLSLAIGGALGVILSCNPLIDLINGPIFGVVESHSTKQFRGLNNAGSGTRIKGKLSFTDTKGDTLSITPSGLHANRMEAMLKNCESAKVVVLLRMDVVLERSCE